MVETLTAPIFCRAPFHRNLYPTHIMSPNELATRDETFSVASIIAIVAAVLSFKAGAILGLLLALFAIVCGLFGILIAVSPKKRGGILSTSAIIAGVIGIIAAVFKAVMWVF